ncbi:hypothetical protein [Pseudoduganella sp. RAF53_2]|uniref:hypothetical protein n=1 Tax=unclassified Pseudoduganella TaxID=2637179 RepID=UPI003F956C4A
MAAAIDHAIDLKKVHGSTYAIGYLRDQRVDEATILRVILGRWCDHRVVDCAPSA